MSATRGDAVFAHRYVFAEVYFHSIDANRSEPSDGANDSSAANTSRIQDRCARATHPAVTTIDDGAIHAGSHRARTTGAAGTLLERRAGATHTTAFGVDACTAHTACLCPGSANATRKLQARCARHSHFIAADACRCCVDP